MGVYDERDENPSTAGLREMDEGMPFTATEHDVRATGCLFFWPNITLTVVGNQIITVFSLPVHFALILDYPLPDSL